ncbi:hypothetical protein ACU4GI_32995 [Cupriavidus basilensis]
MLQTIMDYWLYTCLGLLALVWIKMGIRRRSALLAVGGVAFCGLCLFVALTSPLRLVP